MSSDQEHNDKIDRDVLLHLLLELCRINGPSGKEQDTARFICRRLEAYGLECDFFPEETIPQPGNTPCMLVRIPGLKEGDWTLLSAHMDTVPIPHERPIAVIRKGGMLKSDGSSVLGGDDRAGVAAALEMARIAAENPQLHSGIELLFTVQEELGCRGISSISLDTLRSTRGYNLDGETPPGSIILRAPKKARYTCRVTGKSAHAALEPDAGINAVIAASGIITRLPQGTIDEFSTANIGMISGGTQTNLVPDFTSFTGEIRSFSDSHFAETANSIEKMCTEGADHYGAVAEVLWEPLYEGYQIGEDNSIVSRFKEAAEKLGLAPQLLTSKGGGDSNVLNAQGIDNVVFGLGM
ncbi:MAG: M20/M25/M40 family metallo-hydrolase, partial [Spirochaetia bacterium]|nr:M20/M25/M40 family metallo-hydrolase [Spirochaetia bacterium]